LICAGVSSLARGGMVSRPSFCP